MLVHRVEAGEELREPLGPDREHRGEPDRRAHRVAATDPVPEPEGVRRIDPEVGDCLEVRRDGDEVARDRPLVTAEPVEQPLPSRRGVRHRLERGERLRAHDEQRLGRVEVACRFGEIGSVDVRHEPERQVTTAVVTERAVRHRRAEVGAADADVDDVADRPVREAPSTRPSRTASANAAIRSSTSCTWATTSTPSTTSERLRGIRRATWRTGRFSVTLIRSPANIASRLPATPACSASATSSRSVSSVTRFFE